MIFILETTVVLMEAIWLMVLYAAWDEPDPMWSIIVRLGNFPGAVAYLLCRKVEISDLPWPFFVKRLMLRQKLDDARSAARHIAGAHQYVELGRLLECVEEFREAFDSYGKALEKEPRNADALWGIARLEKMRGRDAQARAALEALLQASPDYKSGEAALAYSRLLLKGDELDAAERVLATYLKSWREPEARYYMARLLLKRQNTANALKMLEEIADDIRTSAPVPRLENDRWLVASETLISQLKAVESRRDGEEAGDGRLGSG